MGALRNCTLWWSLLSFFFSLSFFSEMPIHVCLWCSHCLAYSSLFVSFLFVLFHFVAKSCLIILCLPLPNSHLSLSLSLSLSLLHQIAREERLQANMTTLMALCEKADRDIRSCLNTLQVSMRRITLRWLKVEQSDNIVPVRRRFREWLLLAELGTSLRAQLFTKKSIFLSEKVLHRRSGASEHTERDSCFLATWSFTLTTLFRQEEERYLRETVSSKETTVPFCVLAYLFIKIMSRHS